MAKINATYSSGYYLAPDTDYRKLEEAQQKERKRKRQQDPTSSSQDNNNNNNNKDNNPPIRQTFAIPFNIICLHCNHRIARGTHGYVNRRSTNEKFMGIRIWELEFRCIFCKNHIYLKTDYETPKLTGGYHCSRNCKRGEGDFYGVNQINEGVRAQQANIEETKGTLEALERENEAMRELQERERYIEEFVEAKANVEEVGVRDALLQAIQEKVKDNKNNNKNSEDNKEEEEIKEGLGDMREEEEASYQRFEIQLRRWREEMERREKEKEEEEEKEEDKIAASITAKYTIHEGKRHNVFMEEEEEEEEDVSSTRNNNNNNNNNNNQSRSSINNVQKKSLDTSSSSTTLSYSSSLVGVKRRKGSALASLLDD